MPVPMIVGVLLFLALLVVLQVVSRSRPQIGNATAISSHQESNLSRQEQVTFHCPDCYGTTLDFDENQAETSPVSCHSCGKDFGLLGSLKQKAISEALAGIRPFREKRHFFLSVHGIFHKNPDGTSRQKIIRSCRVGDSVRLIPEPQNPYDPDAVKVCRYSGEQLGYLPAGHRMAQHGELDKAILSLSTTSHHSMTNRAHTIAGLALWSQR